MTDLEQVIAELQYMKRDVLEDSENDITLNKAITLLKEQEAVEPKLAVDALVCGNCGHDLIHQERLGDNVLFEERHNYCPQCGKKVKWE